MNRPTLQPPNKAMHPTRISEPLIIKVGSARVIAGVGLLSVFDNLLERKVVMKPKFLTHLMGLLLLSGCAVADDAIRQAPKVAQHAPKIVRPAPVVDDILRQVKIADNAIRAAQEAQNAGRSAKAIEEAERAIQATQHAKEAHRQAMQSAPDAQQADELMRAFQQLGQTEYEAQLIKLKVQADTAVAAATNKIKSGRSALTNANESELAAFLRDLLCFNLEAVANERQLPSDEDYQKFLRDYAIARFVPLWEIKGKAESIIKFAENTSRPLSAAEVRARMKLLQECTVRRSN